MGSFSSPFSSPFGGDDAAPAAVTQDVTLAAARPPARDLAIDLATRELKIVNGDLVLTSEGDSILQDVSMGLQFWEGEWFADPTYGIPYRQEILVKNPDLGKIRAIFRDFFLSRAGVTQVVSLDLSFNGPSRTLSVAAQLQTDTGLLNVSTQVTA